MCRLRPRMRPGALCVGAILILCAARGGSWDACEHAASSAGGREWLSMIMAGAGGKVEAVSRRTPACGMQCA
jgi:hypothetical protein